MGKRKAIALLGSATAALVLIAAPGPVRGEISQKQGIRVSVDAGIAPKRLPRRGQAPVAVSVKGQIAAQSSAVLPQLQELAIAINGAGHLDVGGIPHCRINHINPSTNAEALAACRSSLIGEGTFSANVVLPEQSPFPSQGKLLAFNGTIGRQPAVFAHIYGTKPIPTSYVFAFRIKQQARGTYGTILETSFPRATGDWGYVTGIELDLDKRFLSAGCPAPKGLSRVSFPLMKTSFRFKGGLKLENTLNRSCEARG